MKFKKLLLISSATLCLVALSACGKAKAQFTNGFESPELDEYFKLPGNLQPVEKEYGMEVVYNQALTNVSLARSAETVLQIAGSKSFFDAAESKHQGGLGTPFSSSSSIFYGKNVTKKYDDELPVAVHTEQSYRSDTDSKGQKNTHDETDYTYITHATQNPDDTKLYDVYSITKGTNSKIAGLQEDDPTKNSEVAYKEFFGSVNLDLAKLGIENMANQLLLNDFQLALPILGGGNKVMEQYCNLQRFNFDENLELAFYSKNKGDKEIIKNINFYSSGKDTMYAVMNIVTEEGHVVSPLTLGKLAKAMEEGEHYTPTEEELIPAYHKANMVAKFTVNDKNQWRCESAGTNSKIFVTKDDNLKTYSKPYCICSQYYCSKLDYKSQGNYGSVKDVTDTYTSTNYGLSVNIYDGDRVEPTPDYAQSYLYDNVNDTILNHVGGIYDSTMTFKKLGYPLEENEHVYHGTFDFNDVEPIFYTAEEEGEEVEKRIDVTDIHFDLTLVNRNGDEDPINILKSVDSKDITFDGEQFEWVGSAQERLRVLQKSSNYEFTIYFTVDKDGKFESVEKIDIKFYSYLSGGIMD